MILFDEAGHREESLLVRYGLADEMLAVLGAKGLAGFEPPRLADGEQRLRGTRWLVRHIQQLEDDPRGWRSPAEPDVEPIARPLRPRLFVSHRQADREYAMRVAWLADQAGFDVWIDVLDPILANPAALTNEVLIATVIEMALLNATHLCAVFTAATAGSQWLPYEYGRVKDKVTMGSRTACAIHTELHGTALPEWVHLGAMEPDQPGVERWLDDEVQRWGAPLAQPTGHWPATEPEPADLW